MAFPPPSDDLPASFDARNFEPPTWASKHLARAERGESSTGASGARPKADGDVGTDSEEDEDVDVGVEVNAEEVRFTTPELKSLLARALVFKTTGNKHFTAKPARLDEARDAYLSALDLLPDCQPPAVPQPESGGLVEVTDDEARAIEAEAERAAADRERVAVEDMVRECTKAVWGNLGAVYLSKGDDKETVDACTKALELDPHYTKALHRRATANERIASWSSLTAAQQDYGILVNLLPASSPMRAAAQRVLTTLPARIAAQQEKEKDEMLGKLKDLGNGLLGRFGLNTDMFKFDPQEGGGYSLRFER